MKTCSVCKRTEDDFDSTEGWALLRWRWTNSDRVVDRDICGECGKRVLDGAPKEPRMRW